MDYEEKREDEAPRDPLAPHLRQVTPVVEPAEEGHEFWANPGDDERPESDLAQLTRGAEEQ